jgi:hypothetical protein
MRPGVSRSTASDIGAQFRQIGSTINHPPVTRLADSDSELGLENIRFFVHIITSKYCIFAALNDLTVEDALRAWLYDIPSRRDEDGW